MLKLIVAIHNFANARKICILPTDCSNVLNVTCSAGSLQLPQTLCTGQPGVEVSALT